MEKAETLQEFYRRKFNELPDTFTGDIGHFNLFHLEPYVEGRPTSIPYRRRDFYKIMLVKGVSDVHYADKIIHISKQALTFSNPQIPYKWEHLDTIREGVYCIFNQDLFRQFGQLNQYEVFQPNGCHVFELSDEKTTVVSRTFDQLQTEFNSGYRYKYDVIRNLIFELLHFALRLNPEAPPTSPGSTSSQRIAALFVELLERQFPIDDQHPAISLRTASDFAGQLNIHVNHLNRSIRHVLQKTTTQVIAERLEQEAKVLLRHSHWSVAEIAYALGFAEPTHFNNFFKKRTGVNPTQFRKV